MGACACVGRGGELGEGADRKQCACVSALDPAKVHPTHYIDAEPALYPLHCLHSMRTSQWVCSCRPLWRMAHKITLGCTYLHTRAHIHMYAHAHKQQHTFTHSRPLAHKSRLGVCTCTHVHTQTTHMRHTHKCMHTHARSQAHALLHTKAHALLHTKAHTGTCACAHTTCVCTHPRRPPVPQHTQLSQNDAWQPA